ncbi:MAG: hypothetical protein AABW88_05540 [Nanoarchaeota archaeon]
MGVETVKEDGLELKLNSNLFKKVRLELVLIVIFAVILLKFISVFDGGLLAHPAPYNHLAGDMFNIDVYADFVKYENDLTTLPFYLTQGIKNVVNIFSMTGPIITAQLSQFTGIESYDFTMHISLLFIILSTAIIYIFLRKIDSKLALLSLPLSLLVFKWPFQYAITWGMHMSNVNMIFIVVSLSCLFYLDKKYIFIVLGIMNGAGFLSHARETLMFNTGVALYFLVRLIKEKILINLVKNPANSKNYLEENTTVKSLKNYIYSIPVMLIFMYRYFPILDSFLYRKSTTLLYGTNQLFAYLPQTKTVSPNIFHHVFFPNFLFYQYILIIGIVAALYFLIFKNNRTADIILSFSIMILANGFFSILGNKTAQIRHLWPVLLIPLAGLSLYVLNSFIKRSIKEKYSGLLLTGLFLGAIIMTAVYFTPEPTSDYPFSDPYTWDAIKWIRSNVENNAKTLILYGDRHGQETMFYLTLKNQFRTNREKYFEQISSKKVSSMVVTQGVILGEFYVRVNNTIIEKDRTIFSNVRESLCDYDYVYSDKYSQVQQVQTYTIKVLEKLINENKFVPVYQNDLVVILKNNNVGGVCFKDEVLL